MFKGMLRRERPDLAARYWKLGVLWSPSNFAASTGRAALETVWRDVEQ
jgi:putative transposase